MFITNSWYVAAWDHEVVAGRLLARTFLKQPVVLYRKADGSVAALEDRCRHRAAPLSLGRIEGDTLRCMYHGLRFDASGRCVEVPGQDVISDRMRVRSFPVVEKDHFLWIWMGDPAKADPATIVDLPWQSSGDWVWKPGYVGYQAHYQLIVDNLLDLSHLSFVHLGTLGTGATALQKPTVEAIPGGLRLSYWDLASHPTPLHARAGMSGPVDRWLIFDWYPPALFLLDAGATAAGTGAREGRRLGGVAFRNTSIQTPESETTTHYFWTHARNFQTDDAALTDAIHAQVFAAFEEDRVVIEAQQRNLCLHPDASMVAIAADAGPLKARRLIEAALAAESS